MWESTSKSRSPPQVLSLGRYKGDPERGPFRAVRMPLVNRQLTTAVIDFPIFKRGESLMRPRVGIGVKNRAATSRPIQMFHLSDPPRRVNTPRTPSLNRDSVLHNGRIRTHLFWVPRCPFLSTCVPFTTKASGPPCPVFKGTRRATSGHGWSRESVEATGRQWNFFWLG